MVTLQVRGPRSECDEFMGLLIGMQAVDVRIRGVAPLHEVRDRTQRRVRVDLDVPSVVVKED